MINLKITDKFIGRFLALKTYTEEGSDINYEVVTRTNTTPGKPNAVTIIAKTEDGYICIKEKRIALSGVSDNIVEVSFPAGLIDEGETPIKAATRELLEETGYRLLNAEETPMAFNSAGMTDESSVIVYGLAHKVGDQSLQDDEQIEVIFIKNYKELLQYVEEGHPISSKLMQHMYSEYMVNRNSILNN